LPHPNWREPGGGRIRLSFKVEFRLERSPKLEPLEPDGPEGTESSHERAVGPRYIGFMPDEGGVNDNRR
jgi:hypothetical protein